MLLSVRTACLMIRYLTQQPWMALTKYYKPQTAELLSNVLSLTGQSMSATMEPGKLEAPPP